MECYICGKILEGHVYIEEDGLCHLECRDNAYAQYDKLSNEFFILLKETFPDLDREFTGGIDEELEEGFGFDIIKERFRANWCLLYRNFSSEELEIQSFSYKKDLVAFLNTEISNCIKGSHYFDVEYILRKGKIIVIGNTFDINVII